MPEILVPPGFEGEAKTSGNERILGIEQSIFEFRSLVQRLVMEQTRQAKAFIALRKEVKQTINRVELTLTNHLMETSERR